MNTRWANITAARIAGGTLRESHILKMRIIFRDALNRAFYFRKEPNASCNGDDALALLDMVRERKPRVSDAQARKGAAFLRGLAYTPKGARRQTKKSREFTDADLHVLETLQGFALVGFDEFRDGVYIADLVPTYRAIGAAGSFDYVAQSWQAGGAFSIINRS